MLGGDIRAIKKSEARQRNRERLGQGSVILEREIQKGLSIEVTFEHSPG